MPLRFEILQKVPYKPLSYQEFEQLHGRPPTLKEHAIDGTNYVNYQGTCPSCHAQTNMRTRGTKFWRQFALELGRAVLFTFLKPIDTVKRLISMQRLPDTCVCEACNESLVVCPHCNAAMVYSQTNPSQELYCPSCGSFMG